MATVTSIADAINTQLLTLGDVDFVSSDNFTPAIETATIAALTLAFSHETTVRNIGMGSTVLMVHRIRTEFWIKHVQGSDSTTMDRARDIGREAINVLVANDGTGYDLHRSSGFDYQVDQAMVQDTQLPWLVATLVTAVQDNGCD